MPSFIPVHADRADRGPDPPRDIKSYDRFLTTVVPTEGLGPCAVP
jgi:hypothetical protein